jgi:hypothetical protein
MPRSLFQKPPIRPIDLFEERRGESRSRQTNSVILRELHSPRQKHPLIVTLIALLICSAYVISVAFVAWQIIGTLTMYRF